MGVEGLQAKEGLTVHGRWLAGGVMPFSRRVMRGRMISAEERCSERDQERMNSGPHTFSIVFSVQPLHVIAVS